MLHRLLDRLSVHTLRASLPCVLHALSPQGGAIGWLLAPCTFSTAPLHHSLEESNLSACARLCERLNARFRARRTSSMHSVGLCTMSCTTVGGAASQPAIPATVMYSSAKVQDRCARYEPDVASTSSALRSATHVRTSQFTGPTTNTKKLAHVLMNSNAASFVSGSVFVPAATELASRSGKFKEDASQRQTMRTEYIENIPGGEAEGPASGATQRARGTARVDGCAAALTSSPEAKALGCHQRRVAC